jgi:ribokinase
MPAPGIIAFLEDPFDEPAGGGGVTASQVAKLGAECLFFTALGHDEAGRASRERLEAGGVRVLAETRPEPHRRAVSATGPDGDRAILVVGPPVSSRIDDALPWDGIAGCAAAYFTGHDPATLVAARRARVLVVTSRRLPQLVASGVRADVVVASDTDPGERVAPGDLPVPAGAIVWTQGAAGGRYRTEDGREGRWAPAPVPGEVVDSYGAGDSFAAGLTVGLARGLALEDALALGARCGAACLTGRGGLAPQLVEAVTG